ncbi:MAG: hypothetical protein J0M24_23190 [Verrucomicrobia bacterium]|nr:hypothetical protein [Verrucomicrobiota bacterium]
MNRSVRTRRWLLGLGVGIGLSLVFGVLVWEMVPAGPYPRPRQLLRTQVTHPEVPIRGDAWRYWGDRGVRELCYALEYQETPWQRRSRNWTTGLAVWTGWSWLHPTNPEAYRWEASEVIRHLKPPAAQVLPSLSRALDLVPPGPCETIIEVLRGYGPAAAPAIPALQRRLKVAVDPGVVLLLLTLKAPKDVWQELQGYPPPEVQWVGTVGVPISQGNLAAARELLAEGLANTATRYLSAAIIVQLDPAAQRLEWQLSTLLDSPDPLVRRAAAELLAGAGRGEAAAIRSVLEGTGWTPRQAAQELVRPGVRIRGNFTY